MTTAYLADTGVFVRCGGPGNEKHRRLRNALLGADVALVIPLGVYEELGGDADEYPSGDIPYDVGIEEGWIVLAEELDYANPAVSTAMDGARRFIAKRTDRPEDRIEKADTELVGLAAQRLATGRADTIVLLTTDKPAGRAAESVLERLGFDGQIEYRYAGEEYLRTISAAAFR